MINIKYFYYADKLLGRGIIKYPPLNSCLLNIIAFKMSYHISYGFKIMFWNDSTIFEYSIIRINRIYIIEIAWFDFAEFNFVSLQQRETIKENFRIQKNSSSRFYISLALIYIAFLYSRCPTT